MGRMANQLNVKKAPYNAKGDGATDDILALEAAVTASRVTDAPSQYGKTVYLPFGHYVISRPWCITNCRGLIIKAEPGTVIEYTGDPDAYGAIQIEGTFNVVDGIHLMGRCAIGIRSWRMTPVSTWIVTSSIFQNLDFSGGEWGINLSVDSRNSFSRWSIVITTATSGQTVSFNFVNSAGATVPISYLIPPASTLSTVATAVAALIVAQGGMSASTSTATITTYQKPSPTGPSIGLVSFNTGANCTISSVGASTGNNEYHQFLNCTFKDYGKYGTGPDANGCSGIYFWGSQVHNFRIFNCRFDGENRGYGQKFGILAQYGAYMSVWNCEFANNYVDIWLRDFQTVNCMRYLRSRRATIFMRIGIGASGVAPVEVSGCDVDHESYLGVGELIYNQDLTIFSGRSGPLIISGCDFKASNTNPMISARGLTNPENNDGPRVEGSRFRGSADYYTAITTVSPPSGTTKYQGYFDMSNTARRYAEGSDNMHWNVTGGAYERIDVQQFLKPTALYSGPVESKNLIGHVDFADGGGLQEQTVTLPVQEDDAAYHVLPAVEIIGGSTTTSYTAKIEAGQTVNDFKVRLSALPVGSDVRVNWLLMRAA